MSKSSNINKTTIGFSVALVAIAIIGYFSYYGIRLLVDAVELSEHTYQVIATLDQTMSNVIDIETGTRGYVITGNEEFLQPYTMGVNAIPGVIENLRKLTSDNPVQLQRIDTIDNLVVDRLLLCQEQIQLRSDQGFEVAQAFSITGNGKRVTDHIRTLISEMRQTEQKLLVSRKSEVASKTKLVIMVIVFGGFIAFIIVGISGLQVHRENRQRRIVESELRRVSEEIRDLYDNAPCGYHSLDHNGIFVQINTTETEWLGYSRDEIIGKKHIRDVMTSESFIEFKKKYSDFIQKGIITDLEFEMVRKDGTIFPVIVNASAVTDSAGNYLRSRSTVFDNTARKEAEQKLNSFFNLSLDMLCIAGFDGYFKKLNPVWEKIVGWSIEELTAIPYIDFVHPDDVKQTMEEASNLTQGKDVVSFENRYRCKDGSYKWILWSCTMSTPMGLIFAAARDITERKRIEDELRFFSQIVANSHDAIFATDPNLYINVWNKAAEQLFGYTREEAVGQSSQKFLQSNIDMEIRRQMVQQLREQGHLVSELEYFTKSGKLIHVLSSSALIKDSQNQVKGFVAIFRDITERKLMEAERQELFEAVQRINEHLAASNKELEAFSYSVSHDLRAPLRHINGFVELIQKQSKSLDPKVLHFLQIISNSAKQMGQLIDDLLSFSRTGRMEMHTESVDLNILIQETIHSLQDEIEGRIIEWKISKLPLITGDRNLLKIAFTNLLSNAVKYTRKNPGAVIQIGIQNTFDSEVEIYVKDNGAGFDMKYLDKLFGVFQRLHSPTDYEGTGIGLATVRRIIHRHGGAIRAEGEINKGAGFYCTLPLSKKIK